MDVNGISQVMTANYENTKVGKEKDPEKKNIETKNEALEEAVGAAAQYDKSEPKTIEQTVKRDQETIEKLKAEAELRTAQLRSLVEKMLMKQGEKFTTLSDALDMIEEGTIEVDDEVAVEAAKEVAEDGYWGVEQTSERLFSFAKALTGNDPTQADSMMEALQKGFDEATRSWGKELPELCQKTLEATKKKLTDWRDAGKAETTETAAPEDAAETTTK